MALPLTAEESELLPRIDAWLSQHIPALITDLADWIAIPSISRADLAQPGAPYGPLCAQVLATVLAQAEAAGFRTETHEGYAGSVIYGDHPKEIGLINHLDVVPAGNDWTLPPFTLTQHGDFLFGRGVGDNKGPGVANLYLLRLFRDLQLPLHHNLRIVYGLAEETDMSDLAWYAKNGPVPEVSLVTDGYFPVNYAQKGQLALLFSGSVGPQLAKFAAGTAGNTVPGTAGIYLADIALARLQQQVEQLQGPAAGRITLKETEEGIRFEAQGVPGHAAFPEGTTHAVWLLFSALDELQLLQGADQQLAHFFAQWLSSPYGEPAGIAFEDAPSGKLTFNAGVWQWDATSEQLQIKIDIRYPVTVKGTQVLSALQETLKPLGFSLLQQRDVAPFYIDEQDERIQLLQKTWEAITGGTRQPYAMGGVTHSKVFPRGITFGPGYVRHPGNSPDFIPPGHGYAHAADEVIHLPSLLEAIPVYVISLLRLDKWLLTQRGN